MGCGVVLILLKTFSDLLPCLLATVEGRAGGVRWGSVSCDLAAALEMRAADAFREEAA